MKNLTFSLQVFFLVFASSFLSAQDCGFPSNYYDGVNYCCGEPVSETVCFNMTDLIQTFGNPSETNLWSINSIEHTKINNGGIIAETFSSFDELADLLTEYMNTNGITADFEYDLNESMLCSYNKIQYVHIQFGARESVINLEPAEGGCSYIFDYEIDPSELVNNVPDPNDVIIDSEYGDVTAGDIMDNWPDGVNGENGISGAQAANILNGMYGAPELSSCLDGDCFQFGEFNADEFFTEEVNSQIQDAIDNGEIEGDIDDIKDDIEQGFNDFFEDNELGDLMNDLFGLGLNSDGECDGEVVQVPFTNESTSVRTESPNEKDYFEDENNTTNTSFDTPSALPSNMDKIVQTSVDKFTGKANSNIDLFNLSSRDLNVPIQLSSSQNGYMVNDPGSEAGQMWDMNELAYVSRQVNGIPDDMNETTYSRGPEMQKKLDFRIEFPRTVGLMFVLGHPEACKPNSCKVSNISEIIAKPETMLLEGIGACKSFEVGAGFYLTLRVSWSPLDPTQIYVTATFLGLIGQTGIWVGVELTFTGGYVVNEEPVLKDIPKHIIGYNYLGNEQVMGELGLDVVNEDNFEDKIKEEKFQNYIFPHKKRDEAAFLHPLFSSFENFMDIVFPNTDPFESPVKQIDIYQDQYTYKVGGYSGNFNINLNNEVQFYPPQPGLKCNVNYNIFNTIVGFTFRTPEGQIYTIGGAQNYIDSESNISYTLNNKYVFPENQNGSNINNNSDQFYEKPQIATERFVHKPFWGKWNHHIGSATYDKNFVISKLPQHNIKWHVNRVKSQITLEEIEFEYELLDPFYQVKSKDLNYTFPNFEIDGTDNRLKTKKYSGLNPFRKGNTKWQNGQADLTYMYSECVKNKSILRSIKTTHSENVIFDYEDNPSIFGDRRLLSIAVEQNDNPFKKWLFEYEDVNETESVISCNETVDIQNYEPILSIPSEWSFELGTLYEPKKFEFRAPFIFKIGTPCLFLKTYPPAIFTPKIIDEPKVFKLTELGSINDLKTLNSDFIDYNLDRDVQVYFSEGRKTFLKRILYEGPGEENSEVELMNFEYFELDEEENSLSKIPKRFSLMQDKYGYINENISLAPFFEIDYIDIYGNLVHNSNQNLDVLFGFKHSGINETPSTGRQISQNLAFKRLGSLKQINYENGSSQSFEFEDNDFSLNGKVYSIGLRVLSHTVSPDNAPEYKTNYLYDDPVVNGLPSNVRVNGLYLIDFNLLGDEELFESKISISTTPLNQVGSVGSGLIGYNLVTEVVEKDNIYNKYKFITAEIERCDRDNIEHFAFKKSKAFERDVLNTPNLFEEDKLAFNRPSYFYGLLNSVESFQNNTLFKSKALTYKMITQDPIRKNISLHDVNYHYGTWLQNYSSRSLGFGFNNELNFVVLAVQLSNMLYNLQFGHYYKKIVDNYIYNHEYICNHVILLETKENNEYFGEKIVSSKNTNSYESVSPYRLVSSLTSLENGQELNEIEQVYFYSTNNFPQHDLFDSDVLTFFHDINYTKPLFSRTIQNGTTIDENVTTLVYKSNDNLRIVPKHSFGMNDGTLRLISSYLTNNDGTISDTYHAFFGTQPEVTIDENNYFHPIEYQYHSTNPNLLLSRTYDEASESIEYLEGYFIPEILTDKNGIETIVSYDSRWRTLSTITAGGRITTENTYIIQPTNNFIRSHTSYNQIGSDEFSNDEILVQYTDGLGRVIRTIRENDGKLLNSQTFDKFGREVSTFNLGTGTSKTTYDQAPNFHKLEMTDSEGNVTISEQLGPTSTFYGKTKHTDANGHITFAYSDFGGRNVKTEKPEGGVINFTFDEFNRLTQMSQENGGVFSYSYNEIDLPFKIKIPGKKANFYFYDKKFNLVKSVDGNKNRILTEYDEYSRPIATYQVDNGAISTNKFLISTPSYNEQDLIRSTEYEGGTDFVLNTSSRLLDTDLFKTTSLINDEIGRPTQITTDYAQKNVVVDNFIYTARGDVFSSTQTLDNDFSFINNYEFDELNRIILNDFIIKKGDTELKNEVLAAFNYNSNDLLSNKAIGGKTNSGDVTAFLQGIEYLYDKLGRLRHINVPANSSCNTLDEDCGSLIATYSGFPCSNKLGHFIVNGQEFSFTSNLILNCEQLDLIEFTISSNLDLAGFSNALVEISQNVDVFGCQIEIRIFHENIESLEFNDNKCDGAVVVFEMEECCDVEIDQSFADHIINNPVLFQQSLKYNFLDIERITYNGDCRFGSMINYYMYDGDHRITDMSTTMSVEGIGTINNGFNTHYEYDNYGNLELLTRNTYNLEDNTIGVLDDLEYSYQHQKISSLLDKSGNDEGVPAFNAGGDFNYDLNGNLTYYPNKNITTSYNLLNLPIQISRDEGTLNFSYFADGSTFEKDNGESIQRYIANFELIDDVLINVYHSEGRFIKNENDFLSQYFLKDHLGNTAVVFQDSNNDGIIDETFDENNEVLQRNYYYPFGLEINSLDLAIADPSMNYKYNGKEMHDDFGIGWSNYGFRFYDPSIARFTGVDPIAESFPYVTVYNYAENRPIDGIDLWGLQYVNVNDVRNSQGEITNRNVNVSLKMKVLNISTRNNFHFNNSLSRAETSASRIFSTSFKARVHNSLQTGLTEANVPINVNLSLSVQQISSLDNVGENDFLAIIVDKIDDGFHIDMAGRAEYNSNIMILEAGYMDGSSPEIMLHELGHNLGLDFDGDPHTHDGEGLMGSRMNGSTSVSPIALMNMYLEMSVTGFTQQIEYTNTKGRAKEFLESQGESYDSDKAKKVGFN